VIMHDHGNAEREARQITANNMAHVDKWRPGRVAAMVEDAVLTEALKAHNGTYTQHGV